jgi:hypothetical protein
MHDKFIPGSNYLNARRWNGMFPFKVKCLIKTHGILIVGIMSVAIAGLLVNYKNKLLLP